MIVQRIVQGKLPPCSFLVCDRAGAYRISPDPTDPDEQLVLCEEHHMDLLFLRWCYDMKLVP